MPVKVSFQFNTAQTIMKIEGAAKKAVGLTAQQVLADCNNYCPQDQSVLINSSDTQSDIPNGKLVWTTPYARYLYHGILMVDPKTGSAYAREGQSKVVKLPEKELNYDKSKNTKAGSHWCERAQADCGENWKKIYAKAFKEELNK